MNHRQPTMSISFDKETAFLYHIIIQESSATHIKASGLIRKILMEHYDNRRTTGTPPQKTGLLVAST